MQGIIYPKSISIMPFFMTRILTLVGLMFHWLLAHSVDNDRSAIQRTITFYFEAVHINAFDQLAIAYHPQAQLTYLDLEHDDMQQFPFGQYLVQLAQQSEHPVHHERQLEIMRLEIMGNAAFAQTRITYPKRGVRLVDYLSLLKDGGEWRIVSRVSYKEYAHFGPDRSGTNTPSRYEAMADIQAVAGCYLSSRRQEDWKRMAESFHPSAQVAYVDPKHKRCYISTLTDYLAELNQETRRYQRKGDIVAIQTCGKVAVVKIATRYRRIKGITFDFLTLVCLNGKWMIIHKATHKDPLAMMVPA
jgi:hypothetical protein